MRQKSHKIWNLNPSLSSLQSYKAFVQGSNTVTINQEFKFESESFITETTECYPFEYVAPFLKYREDDEEQEDDNIMDPYQRFMEGLNDFDQDLSSIPPKMRFRVKKEELKNAIEKYNLEERSGVLVDEGALVKAKEKEQMMRQKDLDLRKLEDLLAEEHNRAVREEIKQQRRFLFKSIRAFCRRLKIINHTRNLGISVKQKKNTNGQCIRYIQGQTIKLRPRRHIVAPMLKRLSLPPARTLMRRRRKKRRNKPLLVQKYISQCNKFILAKSFVHPFIGIYNFSEVGSFLSSLWYSTDKYHANDYYTMLINHYLIVDSPKDAPSLISLVDTEEDPLVKEMIGLNSRPFETAMTDLIDKKFTELGLLNKIKMPEKSAQPVPRLETLNLPKEPIPKQAKGSKRKLELEIGPTQKRPFTETFEGASLASQARMSNL